MILLEKLQSKKLQDRSLKKKNVKIWASKGFEPVPWGYYQLKFKTTCWEQGKHDLNKKCASFVPYRAKMAMSPW